MLVMHLLVMQQVLYRLHRLHRVREGEPGRSILPWIMALSAMEQKFGYSCPCPTAHVQANGAALHNFKGDYVMSNCVGWTCNGTHRWSTASEYITSKTHIPPKSQFSLHVSNSDYINSSIILIPKPCSKYRQWKTTKICNLVVRETSIIFL